MNLNLDKSTWKRVALGDVAVTSKERVDPNAGSVDRYVAGEHMDSDDLKIHRWGDPTEMDLGPAFHRRFRPGQVLYGSRRTYLRKVAVAEFEGVCANTTFVIHTRDEEVLVQEYLPFVLSSEQFHAVAITESKGSVNPYVNWSDIARYEFSLPPLDEQKRIADLLWAAESHRRSLRRLTETATGNYDLARLSLLTVGSHIDWTSSRLKANAVNEWTTNLPVGWRRATISSVGRVRAGATPRRSEHARYFNGGDIPWVKTLDLNEAVVTSTDENITSSAVAESSAKVVPAGTVLIAMYGGFAQIGRTAMLGFDAATNQAVSAVLDLSDDVNPVFFQEVLKAGRPKWRQVAASSRKDPNITKKDVEAFDFPLPPVEEQVEILGILRTIRSAVDSLETESAAAGALQESLQYQVFEEE